MDEFRTTPHDFIWKVKKSSRLLGEYIERSEV